MIASLLGKSNCCSPKMNNIKQQPMAPKRHSTTTPGRPPTGRMRHNQVLRCMYVAIIITTPVPGTVDTRKERKSIREK